MGTRRLIRLDFIIILDRRVAIVVELLGLEAVIIYDLVLLIPFDFVSLAVKVVALKVYLIMGRETTYNLLLFGGTHLESVRQLKVALRVLGELSVCSLITHPLGLWGCLRYLMGYLHIRYTYRNIAWSLCLFLLVRQHILMGM